MHEGFLLGTDPGENAIMGIDPGQRGGIAVLDKHGRLMDAIVMPGNPQEIVEVMRRFRVTSKNAHLVIELAQPMPKQGVTSSFNYGRHFGQFESMAYIFGLQYVEVRPATWKKAMGLTSDKADSIRAVLRQWPDAELTPGRLRKEHDGIAEAILIAEWHRRNRA